MSLDNFLVTPEFRNLKSQNEIKLLICYMLCSVNIGLSKNTIISAIQDSNLANYFEASAAFSDLLQNKNIFCVDANEQLYTVTKSGKLISNQLDVTLPLTVRQLALSATLNILSKIKLENENLVEISQNEHGYSVTCRVSGGKMELMSLTLYVPDMLQANFVKENFHNDPEFVYRCILAAATQNKELVKEILSDIEKNNAQAT